MPTYIYSHPTSGETIEIFQSVKDKHEYRDTDGLLWKRVFTLPQVAIQTRLDPFSSKDFLSKTEKAGSVGDLLDRSKELSEKRKQLAGGIDPMQKAFFNKYAKKRHGKRHESDPKRYEKLKKMNVSVEL